jgi:hypothetical protein
MLANDYLDSWLDRFRGYTFTGFDVVVELATEGMERLNLRRLGRFEGRAVFAYQFIIGKLSRDHWSEGGSALVS